MPCPDNYMSPAQAVQGYRDAVPGSRQFDLRLLEITALTLHEMASQVSMQSDNGIHRRPPMQRKPLLFSYVEPAPPPPTDLFHPGYMDHQEYPHGVASMVGYWAELAIFGGVVLFHRGESGQEVGDPRESGITFSGTMYQTLQTWLTRRR